MRGIGSSIAQWLVWLAYLLLDSAAPGLIPGIPQKISVEKIVEIAKVHQQRCIGEREQWLKNVNQAHLVLASGKLVLQKYYQGTEEH